jgi:hypothetical protein
MIVTVMGKRMDSFCSAFTQKNLNINPSKEGEQKITACHTPAFDGASRREDKKRQKGQIDWLALNVEGKMGWGGGK